MKDTIGSGAQVSPQHGGLRASLGPYLPYLRRYGRALTGSQRTGDAFVRAALEASLALSHRKVNALKVWGLIPMRK